MNLEFEPLENKKKFFREFLNKKKIFAKECDKCGALMLTTKDLNKDQN